MAIYFKSVRYIKGKVKVVIADENDNIIHFPTKEQVKLAIIDNRRKSRVDHSNTKCCLCESRETYIRPNGESDWYRFRDKDGCWSGQLYTCKKCYSNLPDSNNAIQKVLAQCRTGNLSRYSSTGKGYIAEQIVAITLGLDNCNTKIDNFHSEFDLSRHDKYGMIQVKGATFDVKYRRWHFESCDSGSVFVFDYLFLMCMDENMPWKKVIRVYAIPWEEAVKRKQIDISIDTVKPWYQKYEIECKLYDDTYHKMDIRNCKVLKRYE